MMDGIIIMHSPATKIHCFLCNFFYWSGLPLDAFLHISLAWSQSDNNWQQNSHKTVKLIQKLLSREPAGSGRVFSGSRTWPNYGAGFGKTQNILTGNGNWMLPGKRYLSKFVHGMRAFFSPSVSGICKIMTTQIHVLAANATRSLRRAFSCVSYQLSKLYIKWSG